MIFDAPLSATSVVGPTPTASADAYQDRTGDLIVTKVAVFWAVVCAKVILSTSSTSSEAIRKAVTTAATMARKGRAVRVIVEQRDGERHVVWNSMLDGFTAA